MIGIIIVSHGEVGKALKDAVEQIAGGQESFATIGINANDDMNVHRQEILDKAKALDSGKGVIVLTDMFGGTPSNLAISIIDKANVEILAGVNLPMLVKLINIRKTSDMKKAVMEAQDAGRRYIHVASQILSAEG